MAMSNEPDEEVVDTDDGGEVWPVIYPEDIRAAEKYADQFRLSEEDREKVIKSWTHSHAINGDSAFRLHHGLRTPRSQYEQVSFELFNGDLNAVEDAEISRRFREAIALPLDASDLQIVREDFLDKLGWVSELIFSATLAEQLGELDDERATLIAKGSYCAREAMRTIGTANTRFQRFEHFAAKVRLKYSLGLVTFGGYAFSTAIDLVVRYARVVTSDWQSFVSNGKCWSRYPKAPEAIPDLATFIAAIEQWPTVSTIEAHFHQEMAACEIELDGGVIDLNSASPLEERLESMESPLTSSTMSEAADIAEAEDESDDVEHEPIDLTHWAIGIDGKGVWRLFRRYKGDWRRRGFVKIRAGQMTNLLCRMAQGGGQISMEEATTALRGNSIGKGLEEFVDSVYTNISNARTNIKTAIAEKVKCDPDAVPDPFKRIGGAYRAQMSLGYSIVEDGRPEFRLKEQLNGNLPWRF